MKEPAKLTPEAQVDELLEAWAACACRKCRSENTFACLRDRIVWALQEARENSGST
jgi:hypothetical protein